MQDTTEVDYTNLKATEGLGVHGTKITSKGLIVHSNIAVTTKGVTLGLLDQKIWARKENEHGKRRDRNKKPIEEKESYKWLESMEESIKNKCPNIKIIKLVHIIDEQSIEQVKLFSNVSDAILLDTINFDTNQVGGTGKIHNWDIDKRTTSDKQYKGKIGEDYLLDKPHDALL
jgi:hypothetical protein